MISEGIAWIQSMTELAIVEQAVASLIRKQRDRILANKKSTSAQVGFIQRQRVQGKILELRCNATIKELKGSYAFVEVVAPMKFAGRMVQIDIGLLVEPFNIIEVIQTELTNADKQEDEQGEPESPLPPGICPGA